MKELISILKNILHVLEVFVQKVLSLFCGKKICNDSSTVCDSTSKENLVQAKFKYFAVGEYGTESLRPHWHILLFHSSDAIHRVITACDDGNYNENLSEVWSYGSIYSEATDGHISDYLSGYVNCHSNLPEVLSPYPQRKFKSILFGEVRSLPFVASCLKEKRFRELSTVSVTSKKELNQMFPFPLRLSVDYSLDSQVMTLKMLTQLMNLSPALIQYYNRQI